MATLTIEGGYSLQGDVRPAGSKNSVLKLIAASILCSETVTIDNVSRESAVLQYLQIISAMGAHVEWLALDKVSINGATITTHEVPYELGSSVRLVALLAGPLLFRFGKASIPKPSSSLYITSPINRWLDTWKSLGILVDEDSKYIYLSSQAIKGSNIHFKISTHTGTVNALLSSVFASGETIISNAAEESEVDDLIYFLNTIGANIERIEPRKIKVLGNSVFKGGYFSVQADTVEIIAFITAALITKGNVTIKDIESVHLTSFINFLTKLGARYELSKNELSVWYTGESFKPTNIITGPAPGFIVDWVPYATVLLALCEGTSYIHDTIYVNRFGFTQDLNRMGAHIDLITPTQAGFPCIISDDSYDEAEQGEPRTVAKIVGTPKLRGIKVNMDDAKFNNAILIAALAAEGKSEIVTSSTVDESLEKIAEKLENLGAKFS